MSNEQYFKDSQYEIFQGSIDSRHDYTVQRRKRKIKELKHKRPNKKAQKAYILNGVQTGNQSGNGIAPSDSQNGKYNFRFIDKMDHGAVIPTITTYLMDPAMASDPASRDALIILHPEAYPEDAAAKLIPASTGDEIMVYKRRGRWYYEKVLPKGGDFAAMMQNLSLGGGMGAAYSNLFKNYQVIGSAKKGQLCAYYIGNNTTWKNKKVCNGDYPHDLLRSSNSPYAKDWKSKHLLIDCMPHYEQLAEAYFKRFNEKLVSSGYRTYAEQQTVKTAAIAKGTPKYAATPGTSKHGWGLAFDIKNKGFSDHYFQVMKCGKAAPKKKKIYKLEGVKFHWMVANCTNYGFIHPKWAKGKGRAGCDVREPWHFEWINDPNVPGFKFEVLSFEDPTKVKPPHEGEEDSPDADTGASGSPGATTT